jgi:hypothetical protein
MRFLALTGALLAALVLGGCADGGGAAGSEGAGSGPGPGSGPGSGAQGDYPVYATLDDLFAKADLVIEGVPGDGADRDFEGTAYKVYEVEVSRVWKGVVKPGDVVEVKRVRDEEQQLDDGTGYLLFLESYPDFPGIPASTLNPEQGQYPLDSAGAPVSLPGNALTVTAADLARLG